MRRIADHAMSKEVAHFGIAGLQLDDEFMRRLRNRTLRRTSRPHVHPLRAARAVFLLHVVTSAMLLLAVRRQ